MREKFEEWVKGAGSPPGLAGVVDLTWSPRIKTYVHVVTDAMWAAWVAGAVYGNAVARGAKKEGGR